MERPTIPIYGPRALKYAEYELVVPRLEVPVAAPPSLPPPPRPDSAPAPGKPARPEQPPDTRWPTRPERINPGEHISLAETSVLGRLLRPLRRPAPNVVYLEELSSLDPEVRVIEAEEEDFEGIEHEGVILAIGAAAFLSIATFEAVGRLGAELGTETLPIHVQRLD